MTAWEKLARKALVGSHLDSSQWSTIQAGLRDRIFFSSKVCEANLLQAMRQASAEYAKGGTDLSKIRMQIRDYITGTGYKPAEGEEGTIKDLTSRARLNVIIKTNVAQARGFVQWADGQTPGAFAAFPCQEFLRVERRKQPRSDWAQRWKSAGGKFYGGRMIAPKNSPIWVRLNKTFGTPYPPFDWGSGMGVLDVSRREAIRLGVITDEEIKREVADLREKEKSESLPSMNGNLQATVNIRDVEERQIYSDAFGAQVAIDDRTGTVHFQADLLRDKLFSDKFTVTLGAAQSDLVNRLEADPALAPFAEDVAGKCLVVNQDWRGKDKIRREDVDMLPSLWRSPQFVRKVDSASFAAGVQSFSGDWYIAQFTGGIEPRLVSFFKMGAPKT